MRNGSESVYDKSNIFMVIVDIDDPYSLRKVMAVTVKLLKCGLQFNLGSVSYLLAATLYQGNPDRNRMLEYRIKCEV